MPCVGQTRRRVSCSPSRRAAAVRLPSRRTCWSSSASPATRSTPSRTASGAASLVDAATTRYGIPREQVIYLHEKPETDAKRITAKSTRDEVAKAFGKLAGAGADDTIFVVLIGHGSFDGKVAKFNLPGPDMTAGGLRAAAEAAGAAPRRVRQHRERERSVRRSAVRARPHHRHRDPERAGVVRDALRRLFRRRADLGRRRRGQEQARQRAGGVRLRPPRGRDGLRAAGHHADRARAARRQRRQGRHRDADRRREGRARGGADVARGPPDRATRCRATRSCARSTRSAARSSAASSR